MGWLISAMIAGTTAFAATNVDDIVLLVLFFTQTNEAFRRRHIVTGQYLGFSLLVLASLPGFLGGLVVPKPWIGFLGLLPIMVGLSQLADHERTETEIQTVTLSHSSPSRFPMLSFLATVLTPQTYRVAAVTVANGGDNIGIYVPLFASSTWVQLVVILTVFFILTGLWCGLAYQLTRHPIAASLLKRYAGTLVPFILIGLGVFILIESKSYELLWN